MNAKSVSPSTPTSRRILIGFLTHAMGVLMALLVSVALPSSLLAVCGQCDDVYCELYYGTGTDLVLVLGVDNPAGAIIFYTATFDTPNTHNPTHSGATPGPGTFVGSSIHIPYGHTVYVRAIAWKSCWQDSKSVTECEQHNPPW